MKRIIINADDFGYSQVFNKSILELIENNLISSTTVMVNWIDDEQEEQIKKILKLKKTNKFSLGLHLEFNNNNYDELINNQYQKFIQTFNKKPSHIDIHKLEHNDKEKLAVQNFCKKYNLPCRNLGYKEKDIIMTSQKYLNGTNLSIQELKNEILRLEDNTSCEILFHPGTYDKNCKSSLNKQREEDVKKIKNIQPFLLENNIKLISYEEINVE